MDQAAIKTPDQRVRVFVSSTLEELAGERRAVSRAITSLRLTPVMFEIGARPHAPQELYRAYLAQSDVFVGLYWQRYGQVGAGMEVSGLEDEFELARGLPRLLYIKTPAPIREARLTDLLSRVQQEASYRTFHTPAELGRLVREDLAALLSERFVAGRAAPVVPHPLPVAATALIGREQAIDDVAGLIARGDSRLITLTGPGGVGKTRLAVAVGDRLRDRFEATVLVGLADATRPEQVLRRIGQAVGADPAGSDAPLATLVGRLNHSRWLLILDNLERASDAARDLAEILALAPGVTMLATSQTALQVRGEREYAVPPLPVPADPAVVGLDEVAAAPAVELFVERARAVRPDFELNDVNAEAVADICRRLEGLPLAIELAAARTRLLTPDALLHRLTRSFDALGSGAVDLPERQHTLRATVEWSIDLLEDAERSMLEIGSVFDGGWTIEAVADVAGLDEDRALELTEALAGQSLIYVDVGDRGPRSRMLETIRAFVAERLAARPDAEQVRRRHAEHFRALAEQADLPLRGVAPSEWMERLGAETRNLAAAVRWQLANDPVPLPHLFRVLFPFRVLWLWWDEAPQDVQAPGAPRFAGPRDDVMGEARSWIAALRPHAESLPAHARAEFLWTAAATALETNDDAAALADGARLAGLLDQIDDAYLRAVSRLAVAWTVTLANDLERGLHEASAALDELLAQDEPLWTAIALTTVGSVETALGRFDAAARHLTDARDRGDRFDHAWLAVQAQAILADLALARGSFAEARALVDQAIDRSLAIGSAQGLALCLSTLSQVELAQGDPERAALLTGATDGLRRRAGRRVWTSVRREKQLAAGIRDALGEGRFEELLEAGSQLDQDAAVAAARAGEAAA